MADKDRDEEGEAQEVSLSPEQRIAKLEKGKLISLILIILLMVFSILQMAAIGYLLTVPTDERPAENVLKIAEFENKLLAMDDIQREAQKTYLQSQVIQSKIDKVLAEADIHNYANMRKILVEQEQNYGNFIRSLQQGMYEISRMVRGSRTWYEVYKEELDIILQGSSARLTKLEEESKKQ